MNKMTMFVVLGLAACTLAAQAPVIAVAKPKAAKIGEGKKTIEMNIKSDKPGVTIKYQEFTMGYPAAFGNSVIKGKPVRIESKGGLLIHSGKGVRNLKKPFMNYTDGKFSNLFFLNSKEKVNRFLCETKIKNLSRVRVTIGRADPARSRCHISIIALVNGKWIPITGKVTQTKWLMVPRSASRNYIGYLCYDFTFAKGSVPAEIDGIGILDESGTKKFHHPRFAQIEAR